MMDQTLSDIRILKLAEMYEHAYEAFVLAMAVEHVHDPAIRKKLQAIAGPKDRHGERIADEIKRLNAKLGPTDQVSIERAALQDVLEVERAARAFYLRFVEEIHDPKIAELFRELASEEARHIRIAEDALAMNDRKAGRPHLGNATERMLRLIEDAPSWEGTVDLSRSRDTRSHKPRGGTP